MRDGGLAMLKENMGNLAPFYRAMEKLEGFFLGLRTLDEDIERYADF